VDSEQLAELLNAAILRYQAHLDAGRGAQYARALAVVEAVEKEEGPTTAVAGREG
jgi:hypothetical protein